MNKQNDLVLIARHVHKTYRDGVTSIDVLKDINLEVRAGEMLAIVGASGSGKSTLLHVLGGLDGIDAGEIEVAGLSLNTLSEAQRGHLRNEKLGFIYQFHHLLPEFSAEENVAMPLMIARMSPEKALECSRSILTSLGLAHRFDHRPSQMSGGERQRCAIARAMVTSPQCILADEPTGNLDRATAQAVFDNFMQIARNNHAACIIVTHDLELASRCDRILTLQDGVLLKAK